MHIQWQQGKFEGIRAKSPQTESPPPHSFLFTRTKYPQYTLQVLRTESPPPSLLDRIYFYNWTVFNLDII